MPQSPASASPRIGRPVIVLTGGGSGGHITPLLSLARALKKADPDCRIVYIGHKGDRFDRLQEHYHDFDAVAFVSAGKFRRYAGRGWSERLSDFGTAALNIRDFFRLFGSTAAAYRILRKVRPDVVFSKGSFVAVPVGVAARIRGIPIVTHDSDASPGLANRLIGRWTKLHTTAMPARFYSYPKETIRHVGIPIDERTRKVTRDMQANFKSLVEVKPDEFIILITGGGLGSQTVNDKVVAIAPRIIMENPKLHIIHIAGQQKEEVIKAAYKEALDGEAARRVQVMGFSGNFYELVGAADLIIARAGATSLAEFAAAGKPVILIPSPFLTAGHQLKNAKELQKDGAVVVVAEDAPPEELYAEVDKLIKNPKIRGRLAEKLAETARLDAADKLAQILLEAATARL